MVAAQAHQKGSKKSATSPSSMKTIQNIFFCMGTIVVAGNVSTQNPCPRVSMRMANWTKPLTRRTRVRGAAVCVG
jgi:hypothetical protein